MIKNIVVLCVTIVNAKAAPSPPYNWSGKWFPHNPSEEDTNAVVMSSGSSHDLFDAHHGIKMGVEDPSCDDGRTNLEIDWYLDPVNYTCFEDKSLYLPKGHIHPVHNVDHIPKAYSAPHKCLNESIEHNEVIPTFGTHRPLWAVYGEYKFLPKQRWLHNLEHGAVVMLYHPCANGNQVNLLKSIVKSCLYRHVITPYDQLSPERPLALVTWGNRLEISKVSLEVAVDFIKTHALKGPEKTSRDGQYNLMLDGHAKIVTNQEDQVICPKYDKVTSMK